MDKEWGMISSDVDQVLWLGESEISLSEHRQTFPSAMDGFANTYIKDIGLFNPIKEIRRNIPTERIMKKIFWVNGHPTAVILVGRNEGNNSSFLDTLTREKDGKIELLEIENTGYANVLKQYDEVIAKMENRQLSLESALNEFEAIKQLRMKTETEQTPVKLEVGGTEEKQ